MFLSTLPPLARALAERDYTEPTPVQAAVLDDAAAGRDLLVSAQTGSGKTVAYGLAVAADVLADGETAGPVGPPLVLVVAPTRELAMQVERELGWLYAHAAVKVVSCVGGMDPRRERRRLDEGAHVVVGTPGRLRDHLERGNLDVSALAAIVLDEADEMLDLGFREDLEFILDATPAERRTLLFSATLPKAIVTLAERYQNDALRIAVAGREGGHADIEYRAVRVATGELELAVVNVLRQIEAPVSMVFLNTRTAVRHLQAMLVERGFAAVALSGELGQGERNQALQALRDGRARVCVATDVAARGIDLPNLGLVVHVDLPTNAETLQHRSGRTGRAGRKGISVLMVPNARRRRAEILLSAARVTATWSGPPTAEEIRRLDQERMLADPVLGEAAGEDDLAVARALLATRSAEEIAAALVRLFRARLPAPEEVVDPGPGRERAPRHERISGGDEAAGEPGRGRDRARFEGSSWFRLSVGRRDKADPRWILPLICRRGGITRAEVGAIRIFDGETRFEIVADAVPGFVETVARTDGGEARIAPLGDDPAAPARSDRPARTPERPARPRAAGDAFDPPSQRTPPHRDEPGWDPVDPPPRPRPPENDRAADEPRPRRFRDDATPRLREERPHGRRHDGSAGRKAGKGKSHQARWRLERLEGRQENERGRAAPHGRADTPGTDRRSDRAPVRDVPEPRAPEPRTSSRTKAAAGGGRHAEARAGKPHKPGGEDAAHRADAGGHAAPGGGRDAGGSGKSGGRSPRGSSRPAGRPSGRPGGPASGRDGSAPPRRPRK